MAALNPYVKIAGPYRVNQVPCPHFQMMVDLHAPRAVVLHTTEGGSIEGAESVFHHHFAPHFTLGKDAHGVVKIDQHVPIGFIGAALEAHNDLAIVQVEVVDFSKEQVWFFDDATADALAHLMLVLESDYGVPLSRPWPTGDWGRAGYQNPHRSSKKFGAVAGYFDHGDIPNNCHWDCGNLDWDKLFALCAKLKAPSAPALVASHAGAPGHA